MPISKSAKKSHRQSETKRIFNLRRKNVLQDTLKRVRKLLAEGEKAEAEKLVPEAYKAIDKAAKRGILKDNTAARKKSRLVATIKRSS